MSKRISRRRRALGWPMTDVRDQMSDVRVCDFVSYLLSVTQRAIHKAAECNLTSDICCLKHPCGDAD
jgi:hypothetical protein